MVVLIVFKKDSHVLFDAAQIGYVESAGESCVVHTAFGGVFTVGKRADVLFEEIAVSQKEEYVLIPLEEVVEQSQAQEPVQFASKMSSS